MSEPATVRGDYFTDRLGAWTEVLLAGTSLGIVVGTRLAQDPKTADALLAALFALEIVGAFLIMRSKVGPMRVAFWLYSLRVLAGVAYLGAVHGDKLARTTLAFPLLVAAYCFVRIRALRNHP